MARFTEYFRRKVIQMILDEMADLFEELNKKNMQTNCQYF